MIGNLLTSIMTGPGFASGAPDLQQGNVSDDAKSLSAGFFQMFQSMLGQQGLKDGSFLMLASENASGLNGVTAPTESTDDNSDTLSMDQLMQALGQLQITLQNTLPTLPPEIQEGIQQVMTDLQGLQSSLSTTEKSIQDAVDSFSQALTSGLDSISSETTGSVDTSVKAVIDTLKKALDESSKSDDAQSLLEDVFDRFSNPELSLQNVPLPPTNGQLVTDTLPPVETTHWGMEKPLENPQPQATDNKSAPQQEALASVEAGVSPDILKLHEGVKLRGEGKRSGENAITQLESLLEKVPPHVRAVLVRNLEAMKDRLTERHAARENAMEQLQAVLEKAPPEVQEALKAVVSRIQSNGDDSQKKIMGKSFQQLQLEMAFDQKPHIKPGDETEVLIDAAAPPLFSSLEPVMGEADTAFTPSSLSIQSLESGHKPVSFERPLSGLVINNNSSDSVESPHQQVVNAARLTMEAGKKEISIQLRPDELGEVRLKLTSNAQNLVSAHLITETREAKEILEKSIAQLFRSLENSGIQVGKITVVQAGASTFESATQQQFDGGQQESANQFMQSSQQEERQQQQQSTAAQMFMDFNSNSFTDGGSSQAGDEASSTLPFDTDVEGEEVSTSLNNQSSPHAGSVDIRI